MNLISNTRFVQAITLLVLFLFGSSAAFAQTTAFLYQGRLTDAGNPANANYNLQFKLFDALSDDPQQGRSKDEGREHE